MKSSASEKEVPFQLPPKAHMYFGHSLFLCPMPNGKLLFSRAEDIKRMKEAFLDIHPGGEGAARFAFADVLELTIDDVGIVRVPENLWKHLGPGQKAEARFSPFGVELWGE